MKKTNGRGLRFLGNMCEWLCGGGSGEWCDVRVVCAGGRTLPAHRSVLASVSPFLKNLLLSCPTEDFPVFIILPDFNLDAMSSVLYYAYHGEVTVEKHKLEMFLDIVKVMQIYIDYQYLPQSYSENTNNLHKPSNLLDRQNVFTREFDSKNDEKYIKIKKGQQIGDLLTSPLNFCNIREKQPKTNDREVNAISFSNLQLEDRQRNSLLRDLFIETYPQNGKVNGLSPSVLVIPNERYRGPTSMLLTNANDKHLSAPHPPSKISNHATDLATCLSIEMQRYEVHGAQNYSQINERSMNYPLQMRHEFRSHLESITDLELRKMALGYDTKYQMSCPSVQKEISKKKLCIVGFSEECNKNKPIKVPILNQVLNSPWCPRQPNNFKPSHKKCDDITRKSIEGTGVKEHDNDGNNNIRDSLALLENDVQQATCMEEPTNSKEINFAIETFQCTTCNQVLSSAESLNSHTKRHSSGGRYNCDECGKSFSQLRNYKYHMSVHRGTREFAATCSVCGKYFNDRGYLSSHMKIHRNRKEYKCSMCPKSFNQRVAYNMHVRIHTGIKPHVCEQCGKAFSRKMLLKQHQRTHSGERPYACPHCDKRFADRSNMTLHLRLHTGVKPFTCMLCPKSFTKKHHLKSHVNFHTGAKPYSCPRCQLGFTQSSNMRTHLKKCSAPLPSST